MQNNNQILIYGKHAVEAVLENSKRNIIRVYCLKENIHFINGKINNNKINVVDKSALDKILPHEAVHQGIAVLTEMLPTISLDNLCDFVKLKKNACIVVLDQVTDPQNIGAIIRSCAAFNADALLVQDKNSPQESPAMVKAAAGTYELLPICRTPNLTRALERLKKEGFWIIGTDGYAKTQLHELKKGDKLAVVMGSEGKGLRRLVAETCDICIRLPISPKVESLNVSTAAAVVLYELNKN